MRTMSTPGPWFMICANVYADLEHENLICSTGNKDTADEVIANAFLIAQAPEMFRLLTEAMTEVDLAATMMANRDDYGPLYMNDQARKLNGLLDEINIVLRAAVGDEDDE